MVGPSRARAWAGRARRTAAEARIAHRQPRTGLRPVSVRGCGAPAPVPSGGEGFDAERALALLEAQCAAGSRAPGGAGRAATRSLILGELGRHAGEVAVQEWDQRVETGAGAPQVAAMANLLGRFPGAADRGPDDPPDLLLGCHWDTRPVADQDPDPARRAVPPPGANDGASGVAVLLELARLLGAVPPERGVVLAFFDGEDLGAHCYGSRLFGRTLRQPSAGRWRPRRAVVVDMVGSAGTRLATEIGSVAGAPALWNEVHAVADALGVAHRFHGPAVRIGDDHLPLQRAGVSAVLLIDPTDPAWHTTADTPERCGAAALDAVGRVLHGLVRRQGAPA